MQEKNTLAGIANTYRLIRMSIPPRFLDEIRNRVTLSDIVGQRVKLTRAGREFKGCCPFHNEKTPSFYVNDDKQFYHCFGCGAHGDVIGFVIEHDNLPFPEAVESLASIAGLEVPQQSPQAIQKAKEEKSLYSLMEDAAQFFVQNLQSKSNQEALKYVLDRGISQETLSAFHIGFAPADGQVLRQYLKEKGYHDKQMIEAGVVRPSTKGGEPYAFFRERVMFPVADRRGRIVAFGGRILPEHLRPPQRGDFKPPKYINSSDTVLFDKGRVLYGESHARQAAADNEKIIVVEGYLDVIAANQYGIKGAVAPMGTALTEDQIAKLWKMIPTQEKVPYLCFDGDNAGRRAAERAAERILPLLKPDHSARIAFLPQGEDPDSLLRGSGRKAFEDVLAGSISLFDFLWMSNSAGRDFSAPEARAGLSKLMEEKIKMIADFDVQKFYMQSLREKISETFFTRKNNQNYRTRQSGAYGRSSPSLQSSAMKLRAPANQSKVLNLRILVASLINHPHIFGAVEEDFAQLSFPDKRMDDLRQSIIEALCERPELDREGLVTYLKEHGFAKELDDILCESVYIHAGFASPLAKQEDILSKWQSVLQAFRAKYMEQEVKAGWREAFDSSSEEGEERLRETLRSQSGEA